MNKIFFSKKIEAKLKQIILSDLICNKYGYLYKVHTLKLIEWLNLLATELKISASDQKILNLAGYGYHWGCSNLFAQKSSHNDCSVVHTTSCFILASNKLERLLGYHFSKLLSQAELLRVAKILLDQSVDSLGDDPLAILLFEALTISWAEIMLDNDLTQISKQVKKDLHDNILILLENNRPRFINDVSKQVLATMV